MPDKKKQKDAVKKWNAQKWAAIMQDSSKSVHDKMDLVVFDMDRLRDAEDMIFGRSANATEKEKEIYSKRLAAWEKLNFESLVRAVAAKTGADPAQIANPKTRTPEQQQLILEESARRQLARMDAFWNSNYITALNILYDTKSVFDPDPEHPEEFVDPEDPDAWSFKESFLWYFFTTRPDLRPSGENELTDADKKQLVESFKRFDAFLVTYFGDIEKAKHCDTDSEEDTEYLNALEAFISAENPGTAQKILNHLNSILPERFVIPTSKLATSIAKKNMVDNGEFSVLVSKKDAKKPIETTCILTYEGKNVTLSGKNYTEYDESVYAAISSLYVYGDQSHIYTPAQVYRTMNGMTESESLSDEQEESVAQSLDKVRFIRAQINCAEELKARNLTLDGDQITDGGIDTPLLMARVVWVRAGGRMVRAYEIKETPILYQYSSALGQVATIPTSRLNIKLLDKSGNITTRSLSNTESRIKIKCHLIKRIEGLIENKTTKGGKGLSNPVVALYDYKKDGETHKGLFSIAGKEDPTREEMRRIREDVEKMLDYWKASKYIKKYERVTRGKKITGYRILV